MLAAFAARCQHEGPASPAFKLPAAPPEAALSVDGWLNRLSTTTRLSRRLLQHVLPHCADASARGRLAATAAAPLGVGGGMRADVPGVHPAPGRLRCSAS